MRGKLFIQSKGPLIDAPSNGVEKQPPSDARAWKNVSLSLPGLWVCGESGCRDGSALSGI